MPLVVHVVDDDASSQTATGYLLKQAGYEVASYPSAEQLLDHLPNESVRGCILLKVRMPGLSGPDLQERLSNLGSALPIIFLTSYLDIPTIVRTIKAGALDFLIKPVSSDQLLQAVGRAIAHHDATRTPECRSLSYRNIDAARAGSLRTCHSRPDQQACRQIVGLHGAHDQGPPTPGDGKNASPIPARTGVSGRAGRHYVGNGHSAQAISQK